MILDYSQFEPSVGVSLHGLLAETTIASHRWSRCAIGDPILLPAGCSDVTTEIQTAGMKTAISRVRVRMSGSGMTVVKCGVDYHRTVSLMTGSRRQVCWRLARGIERPDPARFANMLASEQNGRG